LTSARKITANRANARASTGPQTTRGRARAARNALRHALSLHVGSIPALSEEVEALAHEIAGPGANAETQELARRVAEAQIDLRRVRFARHQFLSDTLSKENYESYANRRMKVKLLRALLRPNPPDISMEALELRPRPQPRKGRTSSRTFYRKKQRSYWPWIVMNGERCHGANLPFEPSMKPAECVIVIIEYYNQEIVGMNFGRTKPKSSIFSIGLGTHSGPSFPFTLGRTAN